MRKKSKIESSIEHPSRQEEDLEITTPEELEEAKEIVGVTSHELAMKRWADKNPESREAKWFLEKVKIADELGLSEATREQYINEYIGYTPKDNYVRPLGVATEEQIIEFIEKVPSLEMYCACGSRMMTQRLLEAIIKKNPHVDLTDISVLEDWGSKWRKEADRLSNGQCTYDDKV